MTTRTVPRSRVCHFALAAGIVLLVASCGRAQSSLSYLINDNRPTLLPSDLIWRPSAEPAPLRSPRLYAFRTPAGVYSDILVRTDAESEPEPDPSLRASKEDDSDLPIEVILSADNPFFDFQRTGDVGGVGYQRLYATVKLLNTETTCLALHCHAATPAGLESDGVAYGPTRFSPALTLAQDLGDGLLIEGFVARTMRAYMPSMSGAQRHVEFGEVLQHPLTGLWSERADSPHVYLFLETLGHYRCEEGRSSWQQPLHWDVVPGIHLRGDSWWVSAGIVLPLGLTLPETALWQVTCACEY